MRNVRFHWLVVWLAACGRIGYSEIDRTQAANREDTSADGSASTTDAHPRDSSGGTSNDADDGAAESNDGSAADGTGLDASSDVTPSDGWLRDASSDASTEAPSSDASPSDARLDSKVPPDAVAPIDAGDASNGARLAHRYDFSGTGLTVVDSIAAAHGRVVGGASLDGSGRLTLPPDNMTSYVDLPNGLVSGLRSATIMVWFTWSVGGAYQRVFDFGSSVSGENVPGVGATYLALSPAYGGDGFATAFLFTANVADETILGTGAWLAYNAPTFAAVTVAADTRVTFFIDGTLLRSATGLDLGRLVDNNVWLGRSQNVNDPAFQGIYDELRIYDGVLPSCAIESAFRSGPNSLNIACP